MIAGFDPHAADYEAVMGRALSLTGEGPRYFAEARVRWLQHRLRGRGSAPATCLDFGCGVGVSASFLTSILGVRSYIGYDPSQESIAHARRAAPPGARFTAELDGVPPESVDLAFTNGVFHHIPVEERDAAVRAIRRTLAPGGLFAFWENNRWNPAVHWVMSRVPFDRDARMLFPFQARALLRRAGFAILGTDSRFIFPKALAGLRRVEPWLCKLPLGGQYLVLARRA